MDVLLSNWITTAIASALLIAFKTQLMNMVIGFVCYFTRSFDKDGDPDTPERGQLLNDATGVFGDITVLQYEFPLKFGAGLWVLYPDGGVEHIKYPGWFNMRKREPPPGLRA